MAPPRTSASNTSGGMYGPPLRPDATHSATRGSPIMSMMAMAAAPHVVSLTYVAVTLPHVTGPGSRRDSGSRTSALASGSSESHAAASIATAARGAPLAMAR